MPRKDEDVVKLLREHTEADERRFDGVEKHLARISGELYVLGAIVVASGIANFLGHVGG